MRIKNWGAHVFRRPDDGHEIQESPIEPGCHCPTCVWGAQWCTVCGEAEGDLAEVCPGSTAPSKKS